MPTRTRPRTTRTRLHNIRPEGLIWHEDSNQLAIRISDLKIYFRDFKNAVLGRPSLEGAIMLASIWLPLFTADFRPFLWFPTEESAYGAYLMFVVVISMLISIKWSTGLARWLILLINKFPFHDDWLKDWLEETESNPDSKVREIRSRSGPRA